MAREKINIRQQRFGFPDEDLKTSLHDEIVLWLKKNAEPIAKRIIDWKESWDPEAVLQMQRRLSKTIDDCKNLLREELNSLAEEQKRHQSGEYWLQRIQKQSEEKNQVLTSLEGWQGLGEPSGKPQINVTSQLEVPIKRERYKTMDIVGYADIVLSISASALDYDGIPQDQFGKRIVDAVTVAKLRWSNPIYRCPAIAFDAKSTIPSLGELVRQLQTYRTYCSWPFYIVSPEARFAEAIADEGFGFIQYPEGVFLRARLER